MFVVSLNSSRKISVFASFSCWRFSLHSKPIEPASCAWPLSHWVGVLVSRDLDCIVPIDRWAQREISDRWVDLWWIIQIKYSLHLANCIEVQDQHKHEKWHLTSITPTFHTPNRPRRTNGISFLLLFPTKYSALPFNWFAIPYFPWFLIDPRYIKRPQRTFPFN